MAGIYSLDNIRENDHFVEMFPNGVTRRVCRVVSMCKSPTITLKNIETGEEHTYRVGSEEVRHLRKLTPEP